VYRTFLEGNYGAENKEGKFDDGVETASYGDNIMCDDDADGDDDDDDDDPGKYDIKTIENRHTGHCTRNSGYKNYKTHTMENNMACPI
jgi:hypothetical protein